MADLREVGFELERFSWTAPGRLELRGRWSGLEGRRLGRPVLTIDAGGVRRRVTALPGGQLAPSGSGEWRATFAYDGDPEEVAGAELEVGRRLVVELPQPRRRSRASTPADRDRLRDELADLRSQIADLRAGRPAQPGTETEPDAEGTEPRAERAALWANEPRSPAEPDAAADDRRSADVKALAAERGRREAAEAALAERDAELANLRAGGQEERERRGTAERELRGEVERLAGELAALREAHGQLQAETTHLQGEVGDAKEVREALITTESERERLAGEVEELRAALAAREEELAAARREAETARAEVEQRLEAERAISTDVREKLATAREEAQRTIEAEAHETERLRAELREAREEAERAVNAERAETMKLREELAARPAQVNGDDDGGEAEAAARRMYERIARELERERAAARNLRRELDAVQAQTAEHRRAASSAAANGVTPTDEAPVPATPAGRLSAARRSEAVRMAAQHRAEAARAAAAHRVPESQPSALGVWATRGAAIALVAGLLLALVIIVSAVA
jgi:hypothetical protein